MICYRDMTFCAARDCAKWNGCERALTDAIKYQARVWWGEDGAPIAMIERMECYEEKPK